MSHEPQFDITEDEKRQGYSSRCKRCGCLLWSGSELIGSPCPGPAEARRVISEPVGGM